MARTKGSKNKKSKAIPSPEILYWDDEHLFYVEVTSSATNKKFISTLHAKDKNEALKLSMKDYPNDSLRIF